MCGVNFDSNFFLLSLIACISKKINKNIPISNAEHSRKSSYKNAETFIKLTHGPDMELYFTEHPPIHINHRMHR